MLIEAIDSISIDLLRVGVFSGLWLSLLALEILMPQRNSSPHRQKFLRWKVNYGLFACNSLLLRLLFPALLWGFALQLESREAGLLAVRNLSEWLSLALTLIIMDLCIWLQHLAFHKFRWLWLIHQVHHSDEDMDVSTGLRFHPLEIALSMLWKITVIWIFGFPAFAVLIYEIMLNGASMFTHSNARLPCAMDRILRWLLVTPDMHRVHHSPKRIETDSNYGNLLALWDRLFSTYRPQPEGGHQSMRIGLESNPTQSARSLLTQLALPFTKKA
ncbi:MAG: sterol desaturase family protein [Candidatus Eutrophobiaceae bacterium]